eukprot:2274191-Rhodomonas_salina.1
MITGGNSPLAGLRGARDTASGWELSVSRAESCQWKHPLLAPTHHPVISKRKQLERSNDHDDVRAFGA